GAGTMPEMRNGPAGRDDRGQGMISWDVAGRVAAAVIRRHPAPAPYELSAMAADFQELTATAEELVEAETGLRSLAGPARARLTDRGGWVEANLASFDRLLRPLTDKVASVAASRSLSLPPALGRQVSGVQVGLLLGWLSGRVLGQYDQLLIEDERPDEQDIVYYVGPNVADLERRYGFPPREFRLWLALHEVTHRAQFTAVPWMRAHFLSLVERTMDGFDPDPRHLLDALKRSAADARAGRNPLADGGFMAVLATPEQLDTIREVSGLMSLLEGHGDVTMDRAGAGRIPNAATFSRVLHERRRTRGFSRAVSVAIGLDAKMRQYEQGERFIRAVERAGGRDLFGRVWEGPEWLPSWAEIVDPARWVARTAGRAPLVG
ncbi:MAG: zinc-dependent metalloprotease, partial [Candidatus Limnocylindrales bacterium]